VSFADFLENELLDHVFSAAAYTAPANLYIGLSTTAPSDAGGNITEPATGAYARVTLANNATNFPAASAGTKRNGVAINFPTATADWGTISHFFIADAITGGNILAWGALSAAKAIANGDKAYFNANDITITLD
jgi:hypothetical protein